MFAGCQMEKIWMQNVGMAGKYKLWRCGKGVVGVEVMVREELYDVVEARSVSDRDIWRYMVQK